MFPQLKHLKLLDLSFCKIKTVEVIFIQKLLLKVICVGQHSVYIQLGVLCILYSLKSCFFITFYYLWLNEFILYYLSFFLSSKQLYSLSKKGKNQGSAALATNIHSGVATGSPVSFHPQLHD